LRIGRDISRSAIDFFKVIKKPLLDKLCNLHDQVLTYQNDIDLLISDHTEIDLIDLLISDHTEIDLIDWLISDHTEIDLIDLLISDHTEIDLIDWLISNHTEIDLIDWLISDHTDSDLLISCLELQKNQGTLTYPG